MDVPEASSPFPGVRKGNSRSGISKNRNAPRASLACVQCRERKIKCDAQALEGRGICSPCRSSSLQCIVKHDDDRKWRASRNYIVNLEERIKLLEGTIKEAQSSNTTEWAPLHESTTRASSADAQNTYNAGAEIRPAYKPSNYPLDSPRWSQKDMQGSVPPFPAPMSIHHRPTSAISEDPAPLSARPDTLQGYYHTPDYSSVNVTTASQMPTPFSMDSLQRPLSSWKDVPQASTISNTQPATTDTSESLHQRITSNVKERAILGSEPSRMPLSPEPLIHARPGSPSYEEDRQVKEKVRLRCFGPTCPLHVLLRPNPPDPLSTIKDQDQYLLSLDSDQFQKELLSIYWEFQSLSVTVVNKDVFTEHLSHATPSEYYSEFLLNCILACAVRLSTRVAIRKLSFLYIKRAKENLVDALEQATIATLQGFCLLSDLEMTSGRDQAGWLYAGIACRLLFDLGLHQCCSDLVRTAHLSEAEAAIRRQVFFSCLVNERLWCIYLGRPSLIKLSDFSTTRPKLTSLSFEIQNLAAWVDLSLMSSEISDIFNCPSLVDEQTVRKILDVDARLHSWYASLPSLLRWNETREIDLHPSSISLHMQFCGVQILVYRTSIMTRRKFSPAAFTEQEICKLRGFTLQQSRLIYHDNAIKIARLLTAFQKNVGLERVPTVMLNNLYIAAIALISCVSKSGSTRGEFESDIRWMISLLDALEALQNHYPVAIRMRLTLSDVLQRSWLANSPSSPLHHKLTTQNSEPGTVSSIEQYLSDECREIPYSSRRTPIFDNADLWIIPESYDNYPQLFDNCGVVYQTSGEGMEFPRRPMMDTGSNAANGLDLLDM